MAEDEAQAILVRAASGIPRDAAFISFATHSAPRNGVKIQNMGKNKAKN